MKTIRTPVAIALVLLSHALAYAGDDNAVQVNVDPVAKRCEISLTSKSKQRDYKAAQAQCKATGYPTVYLVRRAGFLPRTF